MKKLIITDAQGTGKSTLIKRFMEKENVFASHTVETAESFFLHVQNEKFDYIILEESNCFDLGFIGVLFKQDHALNQSDDATLIAVFKELPVWGWEFPILKMENHKRINLKVDLQEYNSNNINDEIFAKLKNILYDPT